MADNSISSNRSILKEFLASIATIQGDLSNITAPPFVLGEASTVEIPQYWADHPTLFVAQAHPRSAEERALLVLKNFLGSLKNQQYAGRDPAGGVKKPLNAFLGELFIGSWKNDHIGETKLVSEQVSHHPPVTACYLWNDKHGIRAEGFTCQEITFSGNVSIKQKGYAIVHIDEFDEDHLIPVPNIKVKGVLTGTPYPELTGTYHLISSSGYVSEIKFEGKGLFSGGSKNGLEAKVYHIENPDDIIYTVSGQWSQSFTIHDKAGNEIETYDVDIETSRIEVEDISKQDPWESRRAWAGVTDALNHGNMKGTSEAKSVVEEGQRKLRKEEEAQGAEWQRVFFKRHKVDPVFEKLSSTIGDEFTVDPEGGIWKIDQEAVKNARKPYHGDLLPTGERSRKAGPKINPRESSQEAKLAHEINGQINRDEKATQIPSNGTESPSTGQDIASPEKEKLNNLQVEAFLRAKYSSVDR